MSIIDYFRPVDAISAAEVWREGCGGMRIRDALRWIEGKDPERVLEISMSIETNSYDLYLKMHQRMPDDKAKEVFSRLAHEEKQHLAKLTASLDEMLRAA